MKHDELVKRLRCLKYGACPGCPMWYSEEVEPNLWRERCAAIDAADAIEALSREAEEYKAAYRKEHNKRIAENRYLYDMLTKAVREKLLMTLTRIEVPDPPKEE